MACGPPERFVADPGWRRVDDAPALRASCAPFDSDVYVCADTLVGRIHALHDYRASQ